MTEDPRTDSPRTDSPRAERKGANRRRLRRRRHSGAVAVSPVKSAINITPFVDVVLVLLIIFMVVTPMLQRGVDVLLPLSINHREQRDSGKQIIISVRQDRAIFLARDRVDYQQLKRRLPQLLARRPVPAVFLKGDRRLNFAPMRRVMEICQQSGATSVSLATEEQKKGN